MAPLKIVLDTCVIESSLRSQLGASYQILKNINTNLFRFGISVPLYLEYEYRTEEIYHAGILKISEKAKEAVLKALAFYADEVPIYYRIRPNLKDENDNMVFECAANYNADYLVTHNIKDFRGADLAPYNFDIITPQQFLKKVLYGRTPN
jgi:putative PIN family toxin of toxin-antitoxin system